MISLLKRLFGFSAAGTILAASSVLEQSSPSMDEQIAAFEEIGLHMSEGLSKEDLLQSFDASEFENDPFFLLLFAFGSEIQSRPWGRFFSSQVWNFDLEAVSDDESYPDILKRMAVISGTEHLLSGVTSQLDWDRGKASLGYTMGRFSRALSPKIDNDWADPQTIQQFIADIVATTKDGKQFWAADNGQAAILVYLNDEGAAKLNALSDGLISPWQ